MNQIEITYRINEKYEFVLVNDRDAMFEAFYNGFKLVLINEKTIKHIYINDHELRNQPIISTETAEKIVESFLEMNEGIYDLAVSSDIHLHVFHLKFMIALAKHKSIKRVVIGGDLFLKWDYNKQPYSRKQATDELSKILTENIDIIYTNDKKIISDSDLKEENKFIWLTGNHDKCSSISDKYPELQEKIKSLPWICNFSIGKYNFRIQHGAYLEHENPVDDSLEPDNIRPEFDQYMEKNNYLILGHRTQYYFDKLEKLVKKYLEENKRTVYKLEIGKFEITEETTEDGPMYIYINGKQDTSWEYYGFDLFWQCAQELVNKKSHLICTNNIRACTPLKTSDKFYEYEMYGGETKKNIWIYIVISIIITIMIIIICIVVYNNKHKDEFEYLS